jgi:hypothetical protein
MRGGVCERSAARLPERGSRTGSPLQRQATPKPVCHVHQEPSRLAGMDVTALTQPDRYPLSAKYDPRGSSASTWARTLFGSSKIS